MKLKDSYSVAQENNPAVQKQFYAVYTAPANGAISRIVLFVYHDTLFIDCQSFRFP